VATAGGRCRAARRSAGNRAFAAASTVVPDDVVVPMRAYIALPVIAIVIGLLASVAGLRRAVGVEPALAFGGP
jgi:hypothetical protein